jgi:hypothetical protein
MRGNAVVAWATGCGISLAYRAARHDFGAPMSANPQCGKQGGAEPAAGLDSRGRAVVAWGLSRGDSHKEPMHTVRWMPGRSAEPVFDISGPPGSRNIGPAIAFDELGNGVVLWEGDDRDQAGPAYDSDRAIRMALYDSTAPELTDMRIDDRRATPRLRYRVSEPARVTVTVERVVDCGRGRRCYGRVGALHRRAATGPNELTLPARLRRAVSQPGSYRARVIALDRAGNRGRKGVVKFRRK